ncbi:8-amino-7-oxononanoate synthase 2 [Candidatus Electronema halotolerans]
MLTTFAVTVYKMNPLFRRFSDQLHDLDSQNLRRRLVPVRPLAKGLIEVDGRQHLNLSGNDYLGLGSDAVLLDAFYAHLHNEDRLQCCAPGSGASRLLTGSRASCHQLEDSLAQLYGKDGALLFNSGWQLNSGLLPALLRKGDLVLADKLCHASLIDGLRLSAAKVIRYPHLDYERLEELLRQHSSQSGMIFVVTESIFSMDGDCADLRLLAALRDNYGAVLYVDEAHAVGVRGERGLGLAEEQGVLAQIDLLIGTFGKAWAGQGAFVVGSRMLCDFLINMARSFIFTTALPPVSIAWLNFILPKIVAMRSERQHLAKLAEQLRRRLHHLNITTGGASQIVPVLLGEAAAALAAAERLRSQGWWVQAVRPPTVPPNTARLRLSLSAAMREEQLRSLADQLAAAVLS